MATLQQLPPEGQQAVAKSLGFMGDMKDFPKYLMQNQNVASQYSALEDAFQQHQMFAQQKKMGMAEGGMPMMGRFEQRQQQDTVGGYVPPPVQSFQEGGLNLGSQVVVYGPDGTAYGNPQIAEQAGVTNYTMTQPSNVKPTIPGGEFDPSKDLGNPTPVDPRTLPTTQTPNTPLTTGATIGDVSAQMLTSPTLPTGADVSVVGVTPTAGQDISAGAGQVSGQVALPSAQAGTATAMPVQETAPAQLQAQQSSTAINNALQQTRVAQGTLDPRTQVTAQEQTASSISQLQAAQGVASQMTNPVQRQIQEGELVTPTANAQTASTFTEQIQAATATPSAKASVAGQL